jgi:hypothetical protein
LARKIPGSVSAEIRGVKEQEVAPGVKATVTTTKTETATGHAVVTSVTAAAGSGGAGGAAGQGGQGSGALAAVGKEVKEGYYDDAMKKLLAKQVIHYR